MTDAVLKGYAADAPHLVEAYEALDSAAVLAPVLDLLPPAPSRILDIGAGTGRDGAWLARQGHATVAAEPVAALREAGILLHPEIRWIDDRLPALPVLRRLGERFDLVLLVGAWQHLPPEAHATAVAAVASLVAPRGRLMLSLRHGPGAAGRPCFPASPDRICALAGAAGLRLLARREADSVQQANRDRGVTWTWLAFERP
jgi:SAM-dependent methyltransferase